MKKKHIFNSVMKRMKTPAIRGGLLVKEQVSNGEKTSTKK